MSVLYLYQLLLSPVILPIVPHLLNKHAPLQQDLSIHTVPMAGIPNVFLADRADIVLSGGFSFAILLIFPFVSRYWVLIPLWLFFFLSWDLSGIG